MTTKTLAERELADLRAQIRLFQQRRVSEVSGVSQATVSKLARGKQGCTWINVRAVQLALHKLARKSSVREDNS